MTAMWTVLNVKKKAVPTVKPVVHVPNAKMIVPPLILFLPLFRRTSSSEWSRKTMKLVSKPT